MLISAELRWFWSGEVPTDFKEWFLSSPRHPFQAGGGGERRDEYLNDFAQAELGIKARGGKPGFEIKGLVTQLPDAVPDGPFKAPAELWTKWTSNTLAVPPNATVSTTKIRWMRKFDTTGAVPRELQLGADEEPIGEPRPARGCNVELTRLTVDGGTVWTFGFEAFGKLDSVSDQLRAVADALAKRTPPAMGDVELASYPTWLSRHVQTPRPSPAALPHQQTT